MPHTAKVALRMNTIRWMTVIGMVVFLLGIAVLWHGVHDRVGYSLGFLGFALLLLAILSGNWLASRLHDDKGYGRAHRGAVIGFCVAVVGIFLEELYPTVGLAILIAGIAIIFVGALANVVRISRGGGTSE